MNLLLQNVLNKWFFVDFFDTFRGYTDLFKWSFQRNRLHADIPVTIIYSAILVGSTETANWLTERKTWHVSFCINNPGIPVAVQFELVHVYPAGIYFWDPAFFSGNPSIFPLGFTSGSRFFYGNPEILSHYIYIGIPLI